MGDIIKRMVAFVLDWNICLLPFMTVIFLLVPLAQQGTLMTLIYICLFFMLMLSALAVFVLRDVIFKGQSIGKRIFKLHVLDNNTMQEASTGKKIVKNLFFFIYVIDGIVLLASGRTIGNYVTDTVVLSEKTIARLNNTEHQPASKAKTALSIVAVVAVIVALMAVGIFSMLSFVQGMLEKQKDTEEYKLAYSYLIESKAFNSLDCDEADIRMNSYSSMKHLTPNSEGATETATMQFRVEKASFTVVCHNKNGEWLVCDDCTTFE